MNPEHGSPEWWEARKGLPTASRFSDMCAAGSGITAMRYASEKVAESLGAELPSFENEDMRWGITYEPDAIEAYQARKFTLVKPGTLHIAEIQGMKFGATPDGLVGADGIIEVKCPKTTTHLMTFVNGFPSDYALQVQGELMATGRTWCDFISYDPRCKGAELYIERVYRDETKEATILKGLAKHYQLREQMTTAINKCKS